MLRCHNIRNLMFRSRKSAWRMAVNATKRGAFVFIEKPFQDQALLARIERVVNSDRGPLAIRSNSVAELVAGLGRLEPARPHAVRAC